MNLFDEMYSLSQKKAKKKIWIFSDLQQRNPDYAKECLDICMTDYNKLGEKSEMIWYLGDSVEGDNYKHLVSMCEMQESAFSALGIPLCYCIGNHDFDYSLSKSQENKPPVVPFYEMVWFHNGWHAVSSLQELYYRLDVGNFAVYFLNDHIAEDKSWISTQGDIWGNKDSYPLYSQYDALRRQIASEEKKVITVSHYAFPGGNRASETLSRLFPLPDNVKIHFCGHAHIGDYDWAKENAYRRISWVNWHDIPQINVSSFEHIRGQKCRSVFLHIYEDDTLGIFFRNHDDGVFSECYFPSKINYRHKILEKGEK